ncbi:phosphotransferase enzyme family protein [Alkalicoccobacillus gibsonii]|uniref:phosphotransferase enzyme family protein n=1 Tax=Alkalicoccobacillus gibsonii TaxID=79881 RepID=UPI001AEEAD36|nr:phosphotransferase [Alkalicoccobacillus gibsonii]
MSAIYGINILSTKTLTERATLIETDNGETFVLKEKESVEAFQREHELLWHSSTKGFPVQQPVLSQTNHCLIHHQNKCFVMYTYLEGKPFSSAECLQDPIASTLLGTTIAKMHQSFVSFEASGGWKHSDLYQMVYGFAVKGIGTGVSSERLDSIYAHIEEKIKMLSTTLPKQLIHRDAHVHNMIFHENELAGVIDFDLVEVNHKLFDLCYCATSVLSEVFYNDELREMWPAFVYRLVEAYNHEWALSDSERSAVWYMMLIIQTIFMAFFRKDQALFEMNEAMFLWIYDHQSVLSFDKPF